MQAMDHFHVLRPPLETLLQLPFPFPFRHPLHCPVPPSLRHWPHRSQAPPPTPRKPRLSLDSLIFAIKIRTRTSHIASLEKPGEELQVDSSGVFKFDVDVNYDSPGSMFDDLGDVKITWNVILRGWRGIFTMIDCERKVSFSPVAEGWFSEELPSPGCCSSEVASGMVADVKLGFCRRRSEIGGGGRKVRAEKVSVGFLSTVNWRYVSMDDGLRYLQHFLVPFAM